MHGKRILLLLLLLLLLLVEVLLLLLRLLVRACTVGSPLGLALDVIAQGVTMRVGSSVCGTVGG